MTRPVSDLPKVVQRLATAVEAGSKSTLEDASLAVKDEMIAGPERVGLSRRSKLAGRRWGARYKIEPAGNGLFRSVLKYFGPIQWIEKGTDPHYVVAKGFGSSRARRVRAAAEGLLPALARGRGAGALRLPDGGLRRAVAHPGTKAKPFWRGVKRRARKTAADAIQDGLRRNIISAGLGGPRGRR
ncbi:MAG: hypothetical protein AAGA90_07950 [Actinomycetota bacterium]